MNTTKNINELPLEVLGSIFDMLPSLSDKLCLAQVHPHIGLAFSCHYGQRFKRLDLTVKNKLSVLLPLCGRRVEHINADDRFDGPMLKLVELHCPNLQSAKIYIAENNINSIKSFLANVRRLSSMTLVNISRLEEHLSIVKLLKFQPNLRSLRLHFFWVNELLQVRNLVNLEELIIEYPLGADLNLHELCYRLKQLRVLRIKTQGFTASEEFDGVPCPALRELQLPYKNTPAILKWILSHAERLEILTLAIDFMDCKPEKFIYRILSECKNLRSLCMPMPMPIKADTDFAHRVVKVVSENGVTSEERPLDLNFHNQAIHDDIQKVMANTLAKQLITIKNHL